LCHSKTRVADIILSPYTSCNSWKQCLFFFQFHKKFQTDALLNFRPSHESGIATQHGHTQTKLRGKPTDIERRVQSWPIWESSRSITFHSFPTPKVSPVQCAQSPYFIDTPRMVHTALI
jgi:hypothetical protein